jgi:ribosomal protein S18 acetylase RimI-like enzyme
MELAREVEPLFGPMVSDPGFQRALENNIARGTAYCIRVEDGAPGSPLAGGLLFSPKPPTYKIGWLAISQNYRGQRLGTRLVTHIIQLVQLSTPV